MALTGQKRRFAEAIVSAMPDKKLSNKEAALRIGCSLGSASATGSRCMRDPEVKEYILAHYPDFFSAPMIENKNEAAAQTELPLFSAASIAQWLRDGADEADVAMVAEAVAESGKAASAEITPKRIAAQIAGYAHDDSDFLLIVKAVCDKLAVSLDPLDYWDSVLTSPWSSAKEKQAAAAEKAKYTKQKPGAVSQKDAALERAQRLRAERHSQNAIADFFPPADEPSEKPRFGVRKWPVQ